MNYESMLRAELIAELKAWESKSDDLFNQKHKKRITELEQKYKNFDSEIRQKYKKEFDKQIKSFMELEALEGDEKYKKVEELSEMKLTSIPDGWDAFVFINVRKRRLSEKYNKMITAYNEYKELLEKYERL